MEAGQAVGALQGEAAGATATVGPKTPQLCLDPGLKPSRLHAGRLLWFQLQQLLDLNRGSSASSSCLPCLVPEDGAIPLLVPASSHIPTSPPGCVACYHPAALGGWLAGAHCADCPNTAMPVSTAVPEQGRTLSGVPAAACGIRSSTSQAIYESGPEGSRCAHVQVTWWLMHKNTASHGCTVFKTQGGMSQEASRL